MIWTKINFTINKLKITEAFPYIQQPQPFQPQLFPIKIKNRFFLNNQYSINIKIDYILQIVRILIMYQFIKW